MLVVKDACILRRVKMSDVYNWIPLKIYLKSCSIVDAFRCNLHKIHEIEIDIKKNLWYYKFNVSSTLMLSLFFFYLRLWYSNIRLDIKPV